FVGWRMTRPLEADALYASIADSIESNGTKDLRPVADNVLEFLQRFPNDPRAAEVQTYAEELELQKLERQLRVRARLRGEKVVHPAAIIYADAIAFEESDPARAAAMLESLLALYRPGGTAEKVGDEHRPYV